MNYVDKKWVAIIAASLIFVGGIVFIKSRMATTRINPDLISTQLNTIQNQLDSLKINTQKPIEKPDLSLINQDVNKLAVLIEELKSKDESQINQLLMQNRTELNHKLDAIHQVITDLDKKNKPVKYLPERVLPFKIVSIDSIQQVSVVTVSYHFKTMPLEKTDTLAGWTILQIDFGKQRIELENTNKERVLISLGAHHD